MGAQMWKIGDYAMWRRPLNYSLPVQLVEPGSLPSTWKICLTKGPGGDPEPNVSWGWEKEFDVIHPLILLAYQAGVTGR